MVGIVVVSHSRALARAAVALAEEMVHGTSGPRIVVAAGLDETTTGTDATAILQALTEADDGDGVVVLMDLGSAVLSAELALDLMDDDAARSRVLLCPAPLVEGLVAAAVAAYGGADRGEVAAEAAASLAGKQTHLGAVGTGTPHGADTGMPAGADAGTPQRGTPGGDGPAEVVGSFVLANPHGLHARPAARLVQQVRALDAEVRLRNVTTGAGPVAASSLSQVATLGALVGHEIEVRAGGPAAAEAVRTLVSLAAEGFGETVAATGAPVAAAVPSARVGRAEGEWGGLAASPGVVIGPVIRAGSGGVSLDADLPGVRCSVEGPVDVAAERHRLDEALTRVRARLRVLRDRTAGEVGPAEAAIFDAHLLMLDDADVLEEVGDRIVAGETAASAWQRVLLAVHDRFAALPDPYLRTRAADVRAVGEQVLRELLGEPDPRSGAGPDPRSGTGPDLRSGTGPDREPAIRGVLVSADLTPAEAAELDPARVAGVVLAYGSPTAHSAILARARGIPAVVAAGPQVLRLAVGVVLAMDGATGELVPEPAADVVRAFTERARLLRRRRDRALAGAAAPARTRDGAGVLVGANLGSVDDARAAASCGADLAGLVRTEFLFLGRSKAPDIDEQEKAYAALAEALGGRRLLLRTLDVGGDKPLPYLPMPAEANPFLGVRGVRLSLRSPQLLADQLLAMVRVAHEVPVGVMFPMVSALDELLAARELLEEAVRRDGRGRPSGLQIGMMVEVPAAALKAAAFARHVDFFSIGTNDLTQYALAAERGNDAVAAVGDPLDPGVLRLVEAVCRGAGSSGAGSSGAGPVRGGPLVAVCGELAADERATAILVGLGVRELSVAPAAVPVVKDAVRAVDLSAAQALAARAVAADGPDAVRALLQP
jgi:phosphoenolpyruvate-protein phosphotransferase/dihydroxyacetone kinase phosphotransfer subunit